MSYQIPIMKIAANVPMLHWQQMHTWQALYQMHHRPDDLMHMLSRQAATAIAHQFVGKVLEQGHIETRDEPEGKVMRFSCVALRHAELLSLLDLAYREGVSAAKKVLGP